jgi:CHAT domain-containing protein/tetratricopeptide (TPR) repeat protein
MSTGSDAGATAPVDPLEEARRLKDAAQTAWAQEPGQARQHADAASALAAAHAHPVIAAFADWAQAIAALVDGQLDTAFERLEQACQVFASHGQALEAAQTRVPQVICLSMLGRHDEALRCGEDARDRFLALRDDLGAGKVEINLGTLLTRQDRHEQAARHYRSASVRGARVGNPVLSIMADIGLAQALTWQFQFGEAARVNERARRRAEARGLAALQGQATLALGRLALLQGRWDAALRHLAQAHQQLESVGAAPQQLMEASLALADAYRALNLLPEAAHRYQQVAQAARLLELPIERSRALLELARTQDRMNHHVLARGSLEQARAGFEQSGHTAALAEADLAEAAWALRAGRHEASSLAAQRAETVLANLGLPGALLDARTLRALADLARGDAAAAGPALQRVRDEARRQGCLPQQVAACVGLGELGLGQGQPVAAQPPLNEALALVDQARRELPSDEFRVGVAAVAERAHDLLVRAVAQSTGEEDVEPLLAVIERGRARAWQRRGPAAGADEGAGDATSAALRTKVRLLRERWRDTVYAGDLQASAAQAQALRDAEAEWQEGLRQQQLLSGQGDAVGAPPGVPDTEGVPPLAALQARLAPDEALLSCHVDGHRLTLVLVRHDRALRLRRDEPNLARRVGSLRFQIDTPRFGAQPLKPHARLLLERVRAAGQAVYDLLLAPLEPALDGVTRLRVLPHRVLHDLPWGCLHDRQRWLIERMSVVQLPSLSWWLADTTPAWTPPRRVAVLGFAGEHLHHVPFELQAVAAALTGPAQVYRSRACDSTLLRRHAPRADVLHLACHGQFRGDNPAFSSLSLADGPFTLSDVGSIPWRAGLVVLSACETGLSRVGAGDERVGLVRGFLLAGARRVLASQWSVDDATTALWMRGFYASLAAGHTPEVAVRLAQQDAIARGEHPFHWAAMTLFGTG